MIVKTLSGKSSRNPPRLLNPVPNWGGGGGGQDLKNLQANLNPIPKDGIWIVPKI